jgi:hypothetical protein
LKKIVFVFILVLISFYSVSAKDISYSLNKYDDEIFNYIEKAYDSDLKEDGYVLGGSFLKEKIEKDDDTFDDYQVILAKYNKNDDLVWKYTYGNTSDDRIGCLTYTYDENGNIDGYLLIAKKSYDIETESPTNNSVLIKISFDGKVVYERELDNIVSKIIPTYNEENIVDGYISVVGNSLIRYDENFGLLFKKDFNDEITDLTLIKEYSKISGYAVIVNNNLVTLDLGGEGDTTITDVSKYKTAKLGEANNGFILYGITEDVKLKKGDTSYYLINYINNEELWETLGEDAASKDGETILLPIYKDNKIKEYFLLYKNEIDSSHEVVKINLDGEVLKKVKKINNNYYLLTNFYSNGSTIYFIGQIDCPEDDNCDYDNNSLYLVSDEDKVIEVKDDTSKNVIIVFSILFVVLVGAVILIKKKTSK